MLTDAPGIRVARKRLDITVGQLLRGLRACANSSDRAAVEARVAAQWSPTGSAVAILSARSGLDLLLGTVDWAPGSEVLLSAITIPHVPMLIRAHGYVPVAVDVDPATLRLDVDAARRSITSRTRALLHAQLLGALDDLGDLADLAQQHDLLLIEDRAEAYDGHDRSLGRHADVALYSFGMIKTLTCVGGGVILVRDPTLRKRLTRRHQAWPVQPTAEHGGKLLRCLILLAVAHPVVYPHVVRLASVVGTDHDTLIRRMSRGYRDDDLLRQVRRRPCRALLTLLADRLTRTDADHVLGRIAAGERLSTALHPGIRRLGGAAARRTHWLFPIVVDDPDRVIDAGRAAGFDLTSGSSTLVAVDPACVRAHTAMANVVYLPAYPQMSDAQIERLAAVVNLACARTHED